MLLSSFAFPSLNPVAFKLGGIQVHWYALSYIVSIGIGWAYGRFYLKRRSLGITPKVFEESLTWLIVGMLVGGRLGHVLFYDWDFYRQHPWDILATWKGGMSFHGALVGVILALLVFARRQDVSFLRLSDVLALLMPIGLFLGRIANFVNGELYGRVTEVRWAVRFPHGGYVPRHPSQLYEALGEGLLLAILLSWVGWKSRFAYKPGFMTGLALLGYGLIRFTLEFYRDIDLGSHFFPDCLTMGQWLSLPMMMVGGALMRLAGVKEDVKS